MSEHEPECEISKYPFSSASLTGVDCTCKPPAPTDNGHMEGCHDHDCTESHYLCHWVPEDTKPPASDAAPSVVSRAQRPAATQRELLSITRYARRRDLGCEITVATVEAVLKLARDVYCKGKLAQWGDTNNILPDLPDNDVNQDPRIHNLTPASDVELWSQADSRSAFDKEYKGYSKRVLDLFWEGEIGAEFRAKHEWHTALEEVSEAPEVERRFRDNIWPLLPVERRYKIPLTEYQREWFAHFTSGYLAGAKAQRGVVDEAPVSARSDRDLAHEILAVWLDDDPNSMTPCGEYPQVLWELIEKGVTVGRKSQREVDVGKCEATGDEYANAGYPRSARAARDLAAEIEKGE